MSMCASTVCRHDVYALSARGGQHCECNCRTKLEIVGVRKRFAQAVGGDDGSRCLWRCFGPLLLVHCLEQQHQLPHDACCRIGSKPSGTSRTIYMGVQEGTCGNSCTSSRLGRCLHSIRHVSDRGASCRCCVASLSFGFGVTVAQVSEEAAASSTTHGCPRHWASRQGRD